MSLLLPPPWGPASPDAGSESALYKGPASHSRVAPGIPVSVLASAIWSSILPAPPPTPLFSTNQIFSYLKDLLSSGSLFSVEKRKKNYFISVFLRAYLRKLVLRLPGTRFTTLIQIALQIEHKIQLKKSRGKKSERKKSPSRVSAILISIGEPSS